MNDPTIGSQFNNDLIQLIALICSLLTNITLVSIRSIAKERQASVRSLKFKVRKYEVLRSCLEKLFNELREISLICENSANSSEVFAPTADKAKVSAFYHKTIYKIKRKADKILEITQKRLNFNNSNSMINHLDNDYK